MQPILTIGHSNHSHESFLALLTAQDIQVVVDVRSAPYSRHIPWFNKPEIEPILRDAGFEYLFMGDILGGKPSDPALRDNQGQTDYEKLARQTTFQQGLNRLEKGLAKGWRIVLMCAEEDSSRCHRHLLLARELEMHRNIPVLHLRKDGTSLRALDLLTSRPLQLDLFAAR